VDVPDVLPLRDFIRHIEVTSQPGKIYAGAERRVAEQVAAAGGIDLARVLEIHGERRLAWKNEAADVGGLLIALILR
jgi:hypothetical protein